MIATMTAAAALIVGTMNTATADQPAPETSEGELDPRPSNLSEEIEADLLACPSPFNAKDGSGKNNIVNRMSTSNLRLLLRTGTTSWGETHIKKRRDEGATNHQLTSYAKTLWYQAYKLGEWRKISDCYYAHGLRYETPGDRKRTMCVVFARYARDGLGSRGVITAYWKSGWSGVTC